MESPLLYSLFVYDLMKQLSHIELESDPIKLGGLEIRLLQFAVALIARSEEDLDRLLSGFEKYSDTSHQITSVKKTETMGREVHRLAP